MKSYRVGILGTSFGRRVQAAGFQRHEGFELAAIAGRDPARARKVADELGVAGAYGDWRELIERERPDVVSIVTPPDLHHPMMLAALDAGAHVLCEKPTALHRFQAAEMRDRARALGKVAAIDHEFRFLPARRLALRLVREGAIGRPTRADLVGRYPIWHASAPRPMNWLAQRERGGGILGALGSHHTDLLRTLFGEPRRVLASVRVQQPRRAPSPEFPQGGIATADDACTVLYRFDEGASGQFDLDATMPYRRERFEIHGTEASLRWEGIGLELWRIAPGREPEPLAIPPELALASAEGEQPLVAPFGVLIGRFHRAIETGGRMDPDFDDAVAVQSALDAARASSEAGAWVTVEQPAPAVGAAP